MSNPKRPNIYIIKFNIVIKVFTGNIYILQICQILNVLIGLCIL